MSREPDAATLLERALLADARASGCPVEIARAEWVRWASATFTGARHLMEIVSLASPALDAWIARLPDTEFALHGHLVADLVVERIRRDHGTMVLCLEILTVEER